MTDAPRGLIDISPKITPDIAVWPGDSPVSREVLCHLDDGATVTLSTLRTTVHLGAHADGANHYGRGAGCIDTMPLERYIGPCHVVRARAERRPGGTRVAAAAASNPPQCCTNTRNPVLSARRSSSLVRCMG